MSFSSQMYGQFANVNPPFGGFAIDGGLRANTPTSPSPFAFNQGDWYPGAGGTGGSVFDESGVPIGPATAQTSGRVDTEEPFGSNDDIFTNGSKFNDYVSALRWFDNSAPDKNDIDNALYHVSRDSGNNQWIFISGDRKSTNGTSYIDFELLQGTIVQNNDGTFTGVPLAGKSNGGGRTKDDIIISMEYTNGGTKPNVYIYQWMLSGTKWSYELVTLADLGTNAFAETNRAGAELNVPYSAFGSNSYQQYAFVEAAVNVTYLLNQVLGGASCSGLTIKTLWVKTKASAAPTAALKDFITPISVDFNFGSTEITGIGPFCADDTTAYLLSAEPSGGTFSGLGVSGTGPYYFTPSSAGAGTHEISYTSSDGSCTGSINIVVYANPTVTVNSPTKCASDSAVTITATPSPTGSYNYAWTVPAGVTPPGNVASFSSSIAGVYSVIITNPTTSCTGSGSGTLTVNSNPTVTVNSPTKCASDPAVTITATPSPAGSYNYAWTVPVGATAPGNVASFTSSVAGTYSVIITNPSTTCTGSGSGILTVNANPSPPNVTYNPPACDETTFSITVSGVISGATYTVKDKDGNTVPGLSPSSPHIALNTNNIIFNNFPAGSGYQVSVSASGCGSLPEICPAPSLLKITETAVSKELSTNKTTKKASFEAYPVPFKDQLTIKYNFDYVSDVKIEVFDTQGVRVFSKTDTNSYLNKEITLDLHTNKAKEQIYIVKLTTDRGTSTKKVMSSQ
ncbi:T9SS type A sorting domain-containing protein [Flavobacterium granuli]|uniref:T9SS type A sorting domain-containing protein n=1 Tax=Flavobacterium granuli TaxID=280093 RepID=UPI001474B6F6|nr:T9SS type A sorting domain-containing protein [Flavobacterium granuli]